MSPLSGCDAGSTRFLKVVGIHLRAQVLDAHTVTGPERKLHGHSAQKLQNDLHLAEQLGSLHHARELTWLRWCWGFRD